MLSRIERTTRVDFDEWRWKVSYAKPLHGKDYWTNKMEKLAEEEQRKAQEQLGRQKSIKKFSWKRKGGREARSPLLQPSVTLTRQERDLFRTALQHLHAIPVSNHLQTSGRSETATMPTPESESFKAAKPTVPPTFDGVNYDDNKQLKAAQDSIIREQWVQSMMARLIREEMGRCYYREGVNHLEKCGHLRERYLQQLKHSKVKGYLFEQQNYVSES
ncbi:hypothetical protein B0A50_01871 [Salinomyces thailandicus]|uniref:NADH-ubiquinone oxidoreductase 12 kDa subunit n=1 Tax=Salinomyces thailandicus TaxID=706561 RepID=A0A4U0UAQ5_9PEZI|nr:hypothetical protein B0A50_01871 [Salinomyces thailandica]